MFVVLQAAPQIVADGYGIIINKVPKTGAELLDPESEGGREHFDKFIANLFGAIQVQRWRCLCGAALRLAGSGIPH